jgi:hypothetical protein
MRPVFVGLNFALSIKLSLVIRSIGCGLALGFSGRWQGALIATNITREGCFQSGNFRSSPAKNKVPAGRPACPVQTTPPHGAMPAGSLTAGKNLQGPPPAIAKIRIRQDARFSVRMRRRPHSEFATHAGNDVTARPSDA